MIFFSGAVKNIEKKIRSILTFLENFYRIFIIFSCDIITSLVRRTANRQVAKAFIKDE